MTVAVDTTNLNVIYLADVLERPEVLFPVREVSLPSAFVWSNEADFDPVVAVGLANQTYAAREVAAPEVMIGQLPVHTILWNRQFLLSLHTQPIAESYAPDQREAERHTPLALVEAAAENNPCVPLNDECFLLARRGHNTWGHWGADTLAIAASVEAKWRGRFRYAIPQSGDIDFFTAMVQSLHYHGIGLNRLVFLQPHRDYCLLKTWTSTPIWRDGSPHPEAITALRKPDDGAPLHRVAFMRRDHPHRNIGNHEEVGRVLHRHGFHFADLCGSPYRKQVELFQSATTIFSVLGSGLTGLVHAPDGVKVIAASPSGWNDRYFYALAQHRRGRWADVKGRSLWDGIGLLRDAAFEVLIPALEAALEVI